jgi:hypothetical protein
MPSISKEETERPVEFENQPVEAEDFSRKFTDHLRNLENIPVN